VQPGVGGVGGGRIRQYTAAGGAPVVCGVETFDTRRGWRVCCAGGQLGCITRALAVGGASARSMVLPMKEDNCEAFEGLALPLATVGAPERLAVGTLLLTSSLLA